jgi:3-oxoacyl-[acyl-carrier protein] reductase
MSAAGVGPRRNVIVSGGGTGIGRAVARRFAGAGDDVTIVGRRKGVLQATADAINAELGANRVRPVSADLSDPHSVEGAASSILLEGKPVDVLVNNAGGVGTGFDDGLAGVARDWEAEFRRNVLTAVLLLEATEQHLRRPGGNVVNVSSIAAFTGGGESYSGAKAALVAWTLDLATRLGPDGIRANVVVPGYVEDTEFFGDRMTTERHKRLVGRTLLGRAGTPDDVAGCVFFLGSRDAAYVTGQLLHVNGGALLGR